MSTVITDRPRSYNFALGAGRHVAHSTARHISGQVVKIEIAFLWQGTAFDQVNIAGFGASAVMKTHEHS